MAETTVTYFPRRRTGCITCKRRHVRCDEGQPTCTNCLSGDRDCEYAPAQLPLRERRKRELRAILPGEHEPWAPVVPTRGEAVAVRRAGSLRVVSWVSRPLSRTAVDPFGTLPVGMSCKARELFHYYFVYDPTHDGGATRHVDIDGVGLALQDPIALQTTVLLAGTHHFWNRGSYLSFSETYYSYKIATIRTVNAALVDAGAWRRSEYARLIAALSLVEFCDGNIKAAETHLAGLALLLSARGRKGKTCMERNCVDGDEELTDRCVIILAIFISALYSRVSLLKKASAAAETIKVIRDWQDLNASDLPGRLSLLRFIPAFLLPPPSTTSLRQPVDVSEILAATRVVTRDRDDTFASGEYPGMEITEVWRKGTPLPLLFQMTNAHISMPARGGKNRSGSPVFSSLSGMLAAVELYLGTVLEMLDVGWTPFTELGLYTVGVLVRDLGRSRGGMDGWDASRRDLWFWKAFVAWASVACIRDRGGAIEEALLYKWIREWSEDSGVRGWEDAKSVLGRVAWPEMVDEGGRFEALWRDITVD